MVTLNVNFDNANEFYFEGEKVIANLELYAERPVNVHSIFVYFVGECYCTSNRDLQTKSSKKNDKEVYFNDMLTVFKAEDEERSAFPEGIHSFSVQYQLPSNLATSLESPQGYVRYSLQACVDVSGTIIRCVRYFTVVSKVCLNNNDVTNDPIVLWKHENQCIFSFLCLRYGQIRIFVHIPKRGYVPGEMLTITAEVCNFNRLPINWVKAVLVQILKYNCSKIEKRKRPITEVTRGCIMPYDKQTWRSETLYIPAIPPTTVSAKGLINVKYKFYFMIKTSWQEKAVTLKQNINIAAVPLMQSQQIEERGLGEGESMVNSYFYGYSNLEPCIFGPHSTGDENSTASFSPLYPIYNELYTS